MDFTTIAGREEAGFTGTVAMSSGARHVVGSCSTATARSWTRKVSDSEIATRHLTKRCADEGVMDCALRAYY